MALTTAPPPPPSAPSQSWAPATADFKPGWAMSPTTVLDLGVPACLSFFILNQLHWSKTYTQGEVLILNVRLDGVSPGPHLCPTTEMERS